ncbi:hypothetical protein QU38_01575, partial [Staphylococcus aureus]
ADPSSFRAARLVGADGRDPLLDRRLRAGAGGPRDAQASVITSTTWRGKRYAVLGLARSGIATVRALIAGGAEVTAWDTREEARAVFGGLAAVDLETLDFDGFDGFVVSPGVPLNKHPLAAKARNAGVPIIGDIELFAEARAEMPPH